MWESEKLRASETPCEWNWSMQGKAVDYPVYDSFNDKVNLNCIETQDILKRLYVMWETGPGKMAMQIKGPVIHTWGPAFELPTTT